MQFFGSQVPKTRQSNLSEHWSYFFITLIDKITFAPLYAISICQFFLKGKLQDRSIYYSGEISSLLSNILFWDEFPYSDDPWRWSIEQQVS